MKFGSGYIHSDIIDITMVWFITLFIIAKNNPPLFLSVQLKSPLSQNSGTVWVEVIHLSDCNLGVFIYTSSLVLDLDLILINQLLTLYKKTIANVTINKQNLQELPLRVFELSVLLNSQHPVSKTSFLYSMSTSSTFCVSWIKASVGSIWKDRVRQIDVCDDRRMIWQFRVVGRVLLELWSASGESESIVM